MCQSKLNVEKSVLIVLTSCSLRPPHTAECDRPSLEPFGAPVCTNSVRWTFCLLKTFCSFIGVGGFNINKAAKQKEVGRANIIIDSDYLKQVSITCDTLATARVKPFDKFF